MKKLFFSLISLVLLTLQVQGQSFNPEHFESMKARNVGPAGMSGRVTAIDVDLSDQDRIFVGSASGGVWLSENGGISWEPIFDDQRTLSIGAIKINQSNPDEIWVGTGEGNPRNSQNSGAGIYKSIDGGKTWSFLGLKETRVIHRIIIDETRPGTVYVGAQGAQWGKSMSRGVFKTTDGGKTWKKSLFVNSGTGIAELRADPSNPNKMIAAMWEFERSPWFFNSGGPGSGLYITYDGGDNWKKLTDEEGLPKGNLGRMGIAFSASNPDIVYALIEAKENALYKSMDGGATWKEHSKHENIGNRPFYYYELYVDPKDENRVYSIYTYVSRSRDGGKTFKVIADYGNNVHPDHHAFWISPTDPSYLIDGNDGGMNISHDGGDTWRFVTNLPVGQFYHVNVDDDFPYNIYGGMQDNGTWVGPGFTLKSGGITNADWQEVYFGDGFDSAAKPDDNRYVYAMSQGGNLGLVDRETGMNRFIKPNNPDTVALRYNWNAAFALEPGSNCGLYYGSQFVHFSEDCGESWTIISPDLTTNDTSKQHQDISGGLTIDATNAENNTCILAIAPSTVDKNVIWVGTDDGNLQITRDGGATWTKVSTRMPNLPRAAWIPQIELSLTNAGEAFVPVNNFRQNDWSAYLYHTTDYGRTWRKIANNSQVKSFVTSIKQDHIEPNLLFMGADDGLYISFNKGSSWNHWNNGLPSVQIRDIAIQKTFDDLVLGTFGRAFWVLDDIAPLREYARNKYTSSAFGLVSATDGYQTSRRSYQGIRFIGQAEFVGDNKGTAVSISTWIKPDNKNAKSIDAKADKKEKKKGEKDKNKIYFHVLDAAGDTVRTFSKKVEKKGLQKFTWNMETDGMKMPGDEDDKDLPRGARALPGQYKLVASYQDHVDNIDVEVKLDPRITDVTATDIADLKASYTKIDALRVKGEEGANKLENAKKNVALIQKLAETLEDTTKTRIIDLCKAETKSIASLQELYRDKPNQKGIQRNPNTLNRKVGAARRYLYASYGKPTPNAQVAIDAAYVATDKVLAKVDTYFEGDWVKFKEEIDALHFDLFNLE